MSNSVLNLIQLPQIKTLSAKELYWLAGILEGEGSFVILKNHGNWEYPVLISVSMADEDIIERISKHFNSSVNTIYPKNPHHKTQYKTTKSGLNALHWMKALYPIMGIRRKKQIKKCFQKCDLSIRGHIPFVANTRSEINPDLQKRVKIIYKTGSYSMNELSDKMNLSSSTICRMINDIPPYD